MSLLNSLFRSIYDLVYSEDFFLRSRVLDTAFVRRSVLSFETTFAYILCSSNSSLSSTLKSFFDRYHKCVKGLPDCRRSCTKQAFSKRRKLIKYEALGETFERVVERMIEHRKPAKGEMRILAIDGTRVDLPTNSTLIQAFGVQKSTGNLPQALVSTAYDVDARSYLDMQVRPHNGNEREILICHLERIKALLGDEPFLVICDRGYPSGETIETLIDNKALFLMRVPSSLVSPDRQADSDGWMTHKFRKAKQALRFRLLHATLPDGSDEILCTNLPNEYGGEELSELYFRRWGIEVSYNFLKSRLQLENLSGITYNAFMQELYASLIMSNLCGAYRCDNVDYECDAGAVPKIKLRLVRNKGNEQVGGQHKGRSGDDTGDEARNETHDEACETAAEASEPTADSRDGRLKSNRRINMATVLSAIRSILPRVLFCSRGSLARIAHEIDVPCLKNILRYDTEGKNRPRVRLHPALKFTQSQRAGA